MNLSSTKRNETSVLAERQGTVDGSKMCQAIDMNRQAIDAIKEQKYLLASDLLLNGIKLLNLASIYEDYERFLSRQSTLAHDSSAARKKNSSRTRNRSQNNLRRGEQAARSLSRAVLVSDAEYEPEGDDEEEEDTEESPASLSSHASTSTEPSDLLKSLSKNRKPRNNDVDRSRPLTILKMQAMSLHGDAVKAPSSSSSSSSVHFAIRSYQRVFAVDLDIKDREKYANMVFLYSILHYNLGLCLQMYWSETYSQLKVEPTKDPNQKSRTTIQLNLLRALASFSLAAHAISDLEDEVWQASSTTIGESGKGGKPSWLDLQQSLHIRLAIINNEAHIYQSINQPQDTWNCLADLEQYICSQGTYSLWMNLETVDEESMLFFVETVRQNQSSIELYSSNEQRSEDCPSSENS